MLGDLDLGLSIRVYGSGFRAACEPQLKSKRIRTTGVQ